MATSGDSSVAGAKPIPVDFVDGLKGLLGLSGLAYIAGFIVVNTRFQRYGISEADWIDSRFISAGALYLFVALPTTVFPYVKSLASLNVVFKNAKGHFFSDRLNDLFVENMALLTKWVGPFLVSIALFATLILFYGAHHNKQMVATFLWTYALWYLVSWRLSGWGAVILNFGFYWRAKVLEAELIGGTPFWQSFAAAFVPSFKGAFAKTFHMRNGRDPTPDEVQANLANYVLAGTASEGFLLSSGYKAVMLFFLSASSFGAFVYPTLPVSIGGGDPQTISLLIAAKSAAGLSSFGIHRSGVADGTIVAGATAIAGGSATGNQAAPAADHEVLTAPLPLLGHTSQGYFVLVERAAGTVAVNIPEADVEGVSYGEATTH